MTEDFGGTDSPGFDLDLLLPSFNPRIPPESDLDPDDQGGWAESAAHGDDF